MTAKETIQTKLTALRRQSRQTGQVRLSTASLALGMEAAIHFFLAAVLAGAVILEGRAPFAVAFVGAAGSGVLGGAALLGACFGYLNLLDLSAGLQYASAAILTFAVSFAFFDWKPIRRPWVMALVAGVFNGFTGFIVLSQVGWTSAAIIRFALEAVLTVGAARAYQSLRLSSADRRVGLLVLLCTLTAALAPVFLYKEVSLGRIFSLTVLLAAAWQGGMSVGTVAGLALGASLDLAAANVPLYTLAWSAAGLTMGLLHRRKRPLAATAAALACIGSVLWTWESGLPLPLLCETFFALPLFLLLPARLLRRLGPWLGPEEAGFSDFQTLHSVRKQLESASQAFHSLCEALRGSFRPPENDNDVATVFDRAAGRVCRSCPLRERCWKEDYTTTFNAMNDATPAMVERGRARAEDFPAHFSQRCLYFSPFLAAVNEEFAALFYRRQYNARIRESRAAVCRQYDQLSGLLGAAAEELSRELAPDLIGQRRVQARAAELGLDLHAAVFRDDRGLLRVEAHGPDCQQLARPSQLSALSELLGVPLRVRQEEDGLLSLLQEEPLMAVAGVAAQKKSGETVSGDAGTYFKRPDGILFLLLCDGMGSGSAANRESSLAIRLLEEFLRAGVDTCHALATLASALALRGEENGGFTTVDLLQVDLFTGEGELFKLGAAPTYVRQGASVRRLAGSSLPAGLAEGSPAAFDRFSLHLAPGDWVVMASDGVCGAEQDQWLMDKLRSFDGPSPKDLARALLTDSSQDATDDRTVLVLRIDRRSLSTS